MEVGENFARFTILDFRKCRAGALACRAKVWQPARSRSRKHSESPYKFCPRVPSLIPAGTKNRPALPAERFVCVAQTIASQRQCGSHLGPLLDHDKLRIARADHPFRVDKAFHVNRDPAGVHKDEVGIPDQPQMLLPKSLDEEFLWMPSKAEHFSVTGSEFFLVHRRCLARARTRLTL